MRGAEATSAAERGSTSDGSGQRRGLRGVRDGDHCGDLIGTSHPLSALTAAPDAFVAFAARTGDSISTTARVAEMNRSWASNETEMSVKV